MKKIRKKKKEKGLSPNDNKDQSHHDSNVEHLGKEETEGGNNEIFPHLALSFGLNVMPS